jgi:AcrR family transcriptional regulator
MTSGPKKRILDTAADLFSKRGYGAVGVREIASTADVNISMISYYFGGKVGILKTIIEDFFNDYLNTIQSNYDDTKSPEENIRKIFKAIVLLLRERTAYCKVGFFEMPNDVPEITEMKAEKIKTIAIIATNMLTNLGIKDDGFKRASMLGPAILSMLFSHFLIKPVIHNLTHLEFNDEYYDEYTNLLTELFLTGALNLHSKI